MNKFACLSLALAGLSGCATARLDLPADPVQVTVLQRGTKALPGSKDTVKLNLGDITGGQVLLSIEGPGDKTIVDTCSMWPGKVVPFEVAGSRYYLKVVDLRNLAVGDDFGVFEISTTPPAGSEAAED